ncbi:helix-turn-helix transcriptional regulator [Pedobacter nototheniae]|uniref:helix-turn-helix transcriptional regulator n=1 Tax=Pedobacter nototheniae TaxID=2488994 RepID=UPI00292E88C4|nr:helix-turn-helix transcriptional regulator [Pedobacter nototheniae]
MSFNYREYYVKNYLSRFLKKLWKLENLFNDYPVEQKCVLPNGCFNIAILQGPGLIVRSQNWEQQLSEGIYLCGQFTKPVYVDVLAHTNATMVQLHPWTPAYFGLQNATVLTDNILAISDVFKGIILNNELITTAGYADLIRQLAIAFTSFAATNKEAAEVIEKASRMIFSANGNIKISAIAQVLNCSTRHLQKSFKSHVGLTPKELSAIIQLRTSVDDIAYPPDGQITLSRVALENKFYDQAHFNNKFQLLLGKSPKNFKSTDYLLSLKK